MSSQSCFEWESAYGIEHNRMLVTLQLKAAVASLPGLGTSLFPAAVRSTQAEEMFLSQIVFKFEENAAYLSQRQLT